MCKPQTVDDSEPEYETINEYDQLQACDDPEAEYDDTADRYLEIIEATVGETSRT